MQPEFMPEEIDVTVENEINLNEISLFDDDGAKKSQTVLLIEIGQRGLLFHDASMDAYCETSVGAILKTYNVRSKDFKEYLGYCLYRLTGKGASSTAITDAINTLEAAGKHDGPLKTVAIRVHHDNEAVFIDKGDANWQIVRIDKSGFSYASDAPIKFCRRNGMTELPTTSEISDVGLLRKYINISEAEFPLVLGWLFCAIAGVKPYPILILQGEQGTGKSTTSKVIRSLVDPSSVPLRAPPRDIRDLLVSASNNHVVVLDNLSGIKPELADCLCRLATGGGIDFRALFTDNEQNLIQLQKPVIINGIDDIAARPDLAERSLIINLPVINDQNRKSERDFWLDFEHDAPQILCGLYQAISSGLRCRDEIKLAEKPRMADVAQWVTACERGLGLDGEFVKAHKSNQLHAIELGIDASPVGGAIMTLMDSRQTWVGKPTELLGALEEIAGERQVRSKAWPQATKGLNNAIKRLQPNFRKLGITIEYGRNSSNRYYRLENSRNNPSYPSQVSQAANDAASSHDGYKSYPSRMTDKCHDMTDKDSNRHSSSPELARDMTVMTDMTDKSEKFLEADEWGEF